VPSHPRSKGLQSNRDTPSDLMRPVRDDDIRDEVAFALAELAGRADRDRRAPLATRTVEALRLAFAGPRRRARVPRSERDDEVLRTRRSSPTEVVGARLPAAPGVWDISSAENAGDSYPVSSTGRRTQGKRGKR